MPRVLFLALDAADMDTLQVMCHAGELPTIAGLMAESRWGISESPSGLFVGAVWPSFWTSLSPANHARYCFRQLATGTYDDVDITPLDTFGQPFWRAIGDAGKRVAVVDIPKTYPTEGLNGIHVCDWGTHDPDHDRTTTWPADLGPSLEAQYGGNTVPNCNIYSRSPESLGELREILFRRLDRKTELLLDLMAREPWDVFLAGFGDTHCVGHQCWHLHDPKHFKHTPENIDKVGNPVKEVYRACDRSLARILANIDENVDVVLLASHGFRCHYDATFMLDDILKKIERPNITPQHPRHGAKRAKRAWMAIPAPLRLLLRPIKTATRVKLGIAPRSVRKYFAIPNNDACGAVRINLEGREPSGRVSPADYDSVCESLKQELLALRNQETGEAIVKAVKRVDELYAGARMDCLPDMLVYWNHKDPIRVITSPRIGRLNGAYTGGRTGDHTPLGLFMYRGSGVVPGQLGRTVRIEDFGPTLAERVGVSLQGVDGKSFVPDLLLPAESEQ